MRYGRRAPRTTRRPAPRFVDFARSPAPTGFRANPYPHTSKNDIRYMWQIPPLRKNNIRYMWQTY
ncbi:hypothetical protein BIFCAT_01697 [Bifidobacterium catenulatum DSM 16992 = JCM 1194 = LMG 11043]|uniref:Uncharacterized protein n=1 Tax=Bifidobacterium catenulatum DSM 16992 = JCM 1194 = LMG 11043 TaxID=566552 RepID=B6XWN6_9BIFI|nr:hypothetical protein BIFCAT_01697 [Bifidobacterium catenulatum DSM 16992 = JCM 1194 = LMG 11043]